jgi:hypothetical protein
MEGRRWRLGAPSAAMATRLRQWHSGCEQGVQGARMGGRRGWRRCGRTELWSWWLDALGMAVATRARSSAPAPMADAATLSTRGARKRRREWEGGASKEGARPRAGARAAPQWHRAHGTRQRGGAHGGHVSLHASPGEDISQTGVVRPSDSGWTCFWASYKPN